MFRGVIILGVGYAIGYSHAMKTTPDILKALTDLTDVLKQAIESRDDEKTEDHKPADNGQGVETTTTTEGE